MSLTDPATPSVVGSCDEAYSPASCSTFGLGSYAYVAADGDGLWIADVSDPAKPIEVGTIEIPGGDAMCVWGSGNANIVALWDGTQSYTRYNAFTPTGIVQVPKGELSTGDPTTLHDFIAWAQANYPAEHYALVIADHGNGIKGSATDNDPTSGDFLAPKELSQAIQGVDRIEGVFAHTCLMGRLESAYQLRGLTDFYVGSESGAWGADGLDLAGWRPFRDAEHSCHWPVNDG